MATLKGMTAGAVALLVVMAFLLNIAPTALAQQAEGAEVPVPEEQAEVRVPYEQAEVPVPRVVVPDTHGEAFRAEHHWQAIRGTAALYCVQAGRDRLLGTGCVIRLLPDGFLVLSAHHVTCHATHLTVALFTEHSYPEPAMTFPAVKLRESAADDLALLRVVTTVRPPGVLPLSKRPPQNGDPVLAVGCGAMRPPYCLQGNVTQARSPVHGDTESSVPIIGGFSCGALLLRQPYDSLVLAAVNVRGDGQSAESVHLTKICRFVHGSSAPAGGATLSRLEVVLVLSWLGIELGFGFWRTVT